MFRRLCFSKTFCQTIFLRHPVEAKGVSQTEVAKPTGIVDPALSEVLKGNRSPNPRHIGVLSRYFNAPP
jgi:transcriptional regulator with XRE-family HTH domain